MSGGNGLTKIVTVSGLIGSGKTSVCRELAALTGWRVVSAGTILRRMAEERGLSLLELNEIAKADATIDQQIDASLIALKDSTEPLIVDSRLAWHFIPVGYKVHLVVDTKIAGERVYSARRSDESYATPEEAYAANAQRQLMENDRFAHYYGIDCEDWGNYDFVLDTGTARPGELAGMVREAVEGKYARRCALSAALIAMEGAEEHGEVAVRGYGAKADLVRGAARMRKLLEDGAGLVRGDVVG
jgi:cytidylate kinase